MLWWLADNANVWFVLLGMVGLGLGTAWWLHRKPKHLAGVGIVVGLIVLLWLLTKLVVTDRKQLELNVRSMAAAVAEGKRDALFQHFAQDFVFQDRDRKALAEAMARAAKMHHVNHIHIWGWEIKEVSRAKGTAQVLFKATVHFTTGTEPYPVDCEARFKLDGDKWLLHRIEFKKFLTEQPLQIPLP